MMGDGYGMMGGPWMMLVFGVLVVVPVWRICQKAGYSGWLSLLPTRMGQKSQSQLAAGA